MKAVSQSCFLQQRNITKIRSHANLETVIANLHYILARLLFRSHSTQPYQTSTCSKRAARSLTKSHRRVRILAHYVALKNTHPLIESKKDHLLSKQFQLFPEDIVYHTE